MNTISPDVLPFRFGFVGLIGAPNAGKSTLCNALVGSKIAIVTHKAQTTRVPVRGLFTEASSQVVLVDTPGIMAPRRALERSLVKAAWNAATDADRLAFILDAHYINHHETETLINKIKGLGLPLDVVLNKVDRCAKPKLLKLVDWLNGLDAFDDFFMVSALKGSGIEHLKTSWAGKMPEGPWHYPKDQPHDAPLYFIAAEMTREKLFLVMHDELPYNLNVINEAWQTKKDGSIVIRQLIYVAQENHRRMILGKGGRSIKRISTEARQEIAQFLKVDVHLFLHVKVKENWVDKPERYSEIGLDFGENDS